MPIAPVEQKRHPRIQPTWELTQRDVLARDLRSLAPSSGGISTVNKIKLYLFYIISLFVFFLS